MRQPVSLNLLPQQHKDDRLQLELNSGGNIGLGYLYHNLGQLQGWSYLLCR